MPATITRSEQSSLRREHFREYMRKLNPVTPARTAIDSGLVVEDLHASLFKTMAARADLDPGSQQLLVGGIGSGRTTELLMTARSLEQGGPTIPIYIDISSETDLSKLNSGALLAGFGRHLASRFSARKLDDADQVTEEILLDSARISIKEFAFGKTTSHWVPESEEEEPDYDDPGDDEPGRIITQTIPGKLKPPFPALQRDIQAIYDPLLAFIEAFKRRSLDIVVLFDGLDRLISPDQFWAVVHQDLRLLRRINVAVLAVAPLSVLYGTGRDIPRNFERVHTIQALNPESGPNSSLRSVLSHRGADTLLEQHDAELICTHSGGILRDLITLARDAGEAAYIDGSGSVKSGHVKSAIEQLGESYLRGLGPDQLKVLSSLHSERSFDVSLNTNIEMLVTGRVLEYSATDFRVHPALWRRIEKNRPHG